MTTAEKLVEILTEKKMTCATAESCTGGGVGYAITAVSGSSAVFWGGIISYDNSVKHGVLGVPEEILATNGAVSSESAAAMADGFDDWVNGAGKDSTGSAEQQKKEEGK